MTNALTLRDRLIPWYIVAFFAVIAIADGFMVSIAVRTQPGTITDHPYEKGLAYNQTIKESEKQDSLGWKGTLDYINKSNLNGIVSFILKDQNGKFIQADKVSLYITRPIKTGMDFNLLLHKSDTNSFQTKITFPEKGLWELRIYAEVSGITYQQSKRIIVE